MGKTTPASSSGVSMTEGMRILVTGGAGFVGSHLVERLLKSESRHTLIVLDDLSTGRLENLKTVSGRERVEFVRGSVLDRELVSELLSRCQATVHLAASVGVQRILDRPVDTLRTNIQGTDCVLEAAASQGSEHHFLLASTSEVYGKSHAVPFREDADLVLGCTERARWSYAASKAVDEWLALAHASESGLRVSIARLFNTAGPRQSGNYGMVLPRLCAQALAGEPLTVFGDGQQTRCFAHVDDVTRCLVGLLEQPAQPAKLGLSPIFNVGSQREVSILELAELVRASTDSASEIKLIPYEQAYGKSSGDFEDMRRRVPDTTKLREHLGFAPDTALEDIVKDVLASLR